MKHMQLWAMIALLVLISACSQGVAPGPGPTPPSPPQEAADPPTSAPRAPAPPNAPPDASQASGTGPAPAPVLSLRRAFALVRHTPEAQAVIQRLGSQLVMVNSSRTGEAYTVSLGENLTERVQFELHFTVSKADGTVRYTDPVTGHVKPVTPVVPLRDPATDQAAAMLGRGETQTAVDLLTKAAAVRPTADIWNLLSFSYLVSGQWQAAADAGQKALELDEFHPYALYNTGMAMVELKQYPAAILHLRDAMEVQPQRVEPYLGLARAYQGDGRYALAADAVAGALKLAPGDAGVLKLQAAVDGLVRHTAPADLTAAAKVRLEDGPYTIYLYPENGERGTSPAVVYIKGPDGVEGLPVGNIYTDARTAFARVDLPDGSVGYFLLGEPIGAHVASSVAWRLFVRSITGQFRQVVFVGEEQPFMPRVGDFMRSRSTPSVQGDRLVATYGDDASGKTTVKDVWQLLSGEAKAVRVESTRENRDPDK